MEIRFYVDPETGEPHIYRHNVSEEEVEVVLRLSGSVFVVGKPLAAYRRRRRSR